MKKLISIIFIYFIYASLLLIGLGVLKFYETI